MRTVRYCTRSGHPVLDKTEHWSSTWELPHVQPSAGMPKQNACSCQLPRYTILADAATVEEATEEILPTMCECSEGLGAVWRIDSESAAYCVARSCGAIPPSQQSNSRLQPGRAIRSEEDARPCLGKPEGA